MFKIDTSLLNLRCSHVNTETSTICWCNEGLRTRARMQQLLPSVVVTQNQNSSRNKINDLCFIVYTTENLGRTLICTGCCFGGEKLCTVCMMVTILLLGFQPNKIFIHNTNISRNTKTAGNSNNTKLISFCQRGCAIKCSNFVFQRSFFVLSTPDWSVQ